MLSRWSRILCVVLAGAGWARGSVVLPEGFASELVIDGFDQPLGVVFAGDGRMFVWEKAGLVWVVVGGVREPVPVIDLSEEVANYSSKGLSGFALDPDFDRNRRIYLLYAVERNYLDFFGTPGYDPTVEVIGEPTIGRITRYELLPGQSVVDPASRRVLLGESLETGIPILRIHETGTLAFGNDGTLLASCGDGAEVAWNDEPEAVALGVIREEEDVDAFRAQLLDSLSGKVLRLDPRTGDGVADNPFFDPAEPRAPRSRVWARGLRNPFRIHVVPAGGPSFSGPRPEASFLPGERGPGPGVILIGDVGQSLFEELDVSLAGGENFGWPVYEGMDLQPGRSEIYRDNLDAPNPLFGIDVAGVGLCEDAYFTFQRLLVPETRNLPWWPNPCDPLQGVPDELAPALAVMPALDWGHQGPARVKYFDAQGEIQSAVLGDPGTPAAGDSFSGACSMAGTWYPGGSYPAGYDGTYFHLDYAGGWIRRIEFDGDWQPLEVSEFAASLGFPVHLTMDPEEGELVYTLISGEILRVRYYAGNQPPVAAAGATPIYGAEPLLVQLDSAGSVDPEGASLESEWLLGEGLPPSVQAAPLRVFPAADISEEGEIIALVFELDPPQPSGLPTLDPEKIRDGVWMNASSSIAEQYTTYYDPPQAKGGLDWIGYEFDGPRLFHGVVWQEGVEYPDPEGGWFESLGVQVRKGSSWVEVPAPVFVPPYPGADGEDFGTFEIVFPPVRGDAIRLLGVPGGADQYLNFGELRILASPEPDGNPRRVDVALSVTDDANAADATSMSVWINNSPPGAVIAEPADGSSYDPTVEILLVLRSAIFDAEQPPEELECAWEVVLHHDEHVHPEPILRECQTQYLNLPHAEDPGEVLYLEITLTVTDPLGLATTVSHYLFPEADCNLNGFDDAEDIALGRSLDLDFDGVPDECRADCNQNGRADSFDLVIASSLDEDGNGVPDECDARVPAQGISAPWR